MKIELGTEKDIDCWMNLVEKVKDSFSGLDTIEAFISICVPPVLIEYTVFSVNLLFWGGTLQIPLNMRLDVL